MKKILLCIPFLFLLMNCTFTLVKEDYRNIDTIHIPKNLKEQISQETKTMTVIDIVNYCLQISSETLSFSTSPSSIKSCSKQSTNCIGYSQFFTTICNYAFEINKCKTKCVPVVGYVSMYGINLCKLAYSLSPNKYKNFVKNHDFVEIRDSDFVFYCDPCLHDILGSDFKTSINN